MSSPSFPKALPFRRSGVIFGEVKVGDIFHIMLNKALSI